MRTATYTVVDASRADPFSRHGESRRLTFGAWYPDATPVRFPLVVFSHGGLGIRTSNQSMFEELVSHGYVMVSIDHTSHALFSGDAMGRRIRIDRGYPGELRREIAREDPARNLEYYRGWMEVGLGDIAFVLDHVLAEASRPGADAAFALADPTRIGLVGHSLGGAAILGVGRMRDDLAAVVALEAPYLTEILRVEDGRFVRNPDPHPVPVFSVYTDGAWGHLDGRPKYGRNRELRADPVGYAASIE